jgi:hypothetical protein
MLSTFTLYFLDYFDNSLLVSTCAAIQPFEVWYLLSTIVTIIIYYLLLVCYTCLGTELTYEYIHRVADLEV